MDEGLEPQIKLKLLEAARSAEPDYPNVKKGIGCGLAALAVAGGAVLFAVSLFPQLSTASKVSMVLGTAFIAAVAAGGFGAFRPPYR